MRILFAAADASDLAPIEVMLGAEGFNVYSTDDAEEAIDLGKLYDYDLILLGDVTSGMHVLKTLRVAKCKTPILRFSRVAGPFNVVDMLNAGADDYLVRVDGSDQVAELVARIHAVVRRSKGHAQSLVQIDTMTVNLDTKSVSVAGQPVHLTGKEYQMLELMALRRGSLITKEMFLNHLYGGMDEPEIKIIDVFICKLRKKLAGHGAGTLVQTVWGRGYLLGALEVASSGASPVEIQALGANFGGYVRETSALHEERWALQDIKAPSLVPEAGQK